MSGSGWAIMALAASLGAASWERHLTALDPSRPMAYFELAEEVADEAASDRDLDLARRLFGLAGALDPDRLGRSACLALADLETNEHAKGRLLALATLLDPRAGALPPTISGQIDPVAAIAVAEALGHYRKGNGARAEAALRKPGAMELLEAYGHVFRGGAKRFIEDCKLYRGGSRKPMLGDQDLLTHLRLEAALLAGANRSWSGELLLTGGRPLIEVDPDRIEETIGVDGSRACYRDGEWIECGPR